MKSVSAPDNSLVKAIKKWKKDQAIISLTLDEMKEEAKGKEIISEQKVDGQSELLSFKKGEESKFASLGGVLYSDLPVIDEAEKILKSHDIIEAQIVGELAGVENGKIIHFDKTESFIKNKDADKTKLQWFPYQIVSLNNTKYPNDFQSYKKSWPELVKLFKDAKLIHPVEYMEDDIDGAWKKYVEKQKNEGIVVRLSNNKVYKVKPVFTYDLVIVAVGDKKKKNWAKGMIGTTLMAFMDNNHIFRTAGEIGTGWTHEESKELFDWANKNKVGEDDHYVWVKPKKIMEVQWERSNVREMPSYKYSKGKYEDVGKMESGTIVKPRFIRYRTDKSVNPNDLRLTQIPDWNKRKKMAIRIALNYIRG